jgi:predicted peptidase
LFSSSCSLRARLLLAKINRHLPRLKDLNLAHTVALAARRCSIACSFRQATTQKYPIVLWLHGAAGRGSDNVSQLSGGNFPGSHIWTNPEIQHKYHAFVLAPQVDVTKGWARPHTNTPPVAIRLALETLDQIEKEYSIDRAREYVAGQSMGGEGVWAALSAAPQRFAAAIALCGYGNAYMLPRVVKVPVWIFQGEEDPVVSVAGMREWVKKLREAGGAVKYTEYPSIGHDVWDVAFTEPGLAEWLFSHHQSFRP